MAQTSNKKRTLLELSLSRIPDAYVRAAFEQVQFAINGLLSRGLETLGFLKAKSVEAQTGAFERVTADFLQCADTVDQRFTVKVEYLELPASSSFEVAYSRRILSVMGYSQVDSGSNWRLMIASNSSAACYFDLTNSSETAVNVVNGYASGTNRCRLVVFLEGKT